MPEMKVEKSERMIHQEHIDAHAEEVENALVPTPYLKEQARIFALEGARLWEETMRLTINDKPRWCPMFLYAAAVRLIIKQEQDRKVFHENWTRRRRFKLFRPKA